MAFIELKNVTFTYPNTSSPALDKLSLKVNKGQFVILFGPSGCGKSTLLRLLKNNIQPHGKLSGEIYMNNQLLIDEDATEREIGFVFQDPENQVVADDVLHELVFGMENIGLTANEMRNRLAEMVHFMGFQALLNRKTHELSGGQKQQVNLASVLLMQPNVLLLDEPTAQLDPVSSRDFLSMLVRLNEEFGMTIIMAEHRLEEIIPIADKIVMMEKGSIAIEGSPRKALHHIWCHGEKAYIPSIPSFYMRSLKETGHTQIPLTVKEGRTWLQEHKIPKVNNELASISVDSKEIIKVKNVYYQYDKKEAAILRDMNFSLKKGELYALLGGNGSGKTTFLKLLSGIYKPQQGSITLHNKKMKSWKRQDLVQRIGYLPQNPKLFFLQDTLEKEVRQTIEQWNVSKKAADAILYSLGIYHLCEKHPYDLSGGELQKGALACLLLRKPEVLLLDEPTKGLDPVSKEKLASILINLTKEGITIFMTSHDVEFVAKYATRCGMMFDGTISSEDFPGKFFHGNFFYTTMIQRLFRGLSNELVTEEEAVRAWNQKE
ncbi:energy-coupling factor transporter ATPase [Evansella sp. AB-P1]|uniref:ABC transporter ATP-binding protein n=1 Tax=Evansella sp. AB-P1 TaxID=3037653 RepID=UPI00241F7806|nr:ABC transporter ATP-binding protein [Evansella sp. AB-P1]MDG5789830.1 energy-coupling factor transporter ATPase [Evansella sp. AB-P1]